MTAASFGQVLISATPTLICSWTRGAQPFKVHLQNGASPGNTSSDVFIGNSSVTGSTGYRLAPGGNTVVIDVPAADRGVAPVTEEIYGVGASVQMHFVMGPR